MAAYEKTRLRPPQVFLNFRGAELLQSFIVHLERALRDGGVNVYVDHVRGVEDRIPVLTGMGQSKMALVIFSQRYTESPWCLDELVKIKERVEEVKLLVIPIYYKVNPSHVKRLEGDFGNNLWNMVKRLHEFDKLKNWKEALDFVSGKTGLVLNEKSNESTFINDIISRVRKDLTHLLGEANSDATPELQDPAEKNRVGSANEENKQENVTYDKPSRKNKVFLSFRGGEFYHGFISFLVDALERNGVSIDMEEDVLNRESLKSLLMRIEESKIALVIFCSRYTESGWCIDELVKISDLVDEGKLIAIPIFYNVESSQVKNLVGEFGDNFWKSWRINRDSRIIQWKVALNSIASKSGIFFREHRSESEVIANIVKLVLLTISELERRTPSPFPSTEKGKSTDLPTEKREKHESYLNKCPLFGMEQRMEQLEKKLKFDCNDDTRIIGVVGMPGIGKTTLAMMLHEKWNRKFTRCVPFLGIRETSEEYGPVWLRKTLLELLLEGKFPEISDETTHGSVEVELLKTKIFAVLDDVSDKEQLEFLLGELDWIKKGSKIIITTCDKSLLEGFADDTYVVPELNDGEAFQLLRYHAFDDQNCSLASTFLKLSRMFVDYARGNPLTLKLVGKELYGSDEAHWTSTLEMVTKKSNMLSQDVWRFFTDQLKLSEKQKDVFLDIMCFLKSEDEYYVRSLLDSGDPDSTDTVSEVKDLVNKFLITIADGRVEMNVPLRRFSKDLGSPRWLRLLNYKDIINRLTKRKKSDANNVRGIFLDTSKLTKSALPLDSSAFVDMRNLRYLKIYNSCCPRQCKSDCRLYLPDGLEFPLEEVRYLHWVQFPLEELPMDCRPENLVDLRLPYSMITRVWEGKKDTPRLKWIDLSHSRKLFDLSGLSNAKNLQRLNLEGCTSLEELPLEIQNMKSLVFLNLRGCISLWSLPEMNLSSLKTLILSDCSNLEEFELISESVEFLHLDGTAIKELPLSIQNLRSLVVLNLKNCRMLECLPNCLGNLNALDKLILSGCSSLRNLPNVRNSLKHLQILLLDGTGAKEMPRISCFNESESPASSDQPLGSHCRVREWPYGVNGVSSLRRLCLSGNDFATLQPDIWKLSNLKWLDVKHCKKLISVPMLPPRLQYFDAHGCDSLETVANPVASAVLSDQIHATFNFSNCNKLDQDAKDNIISYTQQRSQLVLDELTRYSGGLVLEALIETCFPGWDVPALFSHQAFGSVLKTKLAPHWSDNRFTGIALCAVVKFDGYHNHIKRILLKCNCEFKNEDSSIRLACTVGGWSEPSNTPREIVASHVFIGFTSRLDINKISEEDDESCVSAEAIIEFEVTDGMEEINGCEVVKCGFSLVYAPE